MATPTKWGNEFMINFYTGANQFDPSVAALANGRSVVVWTDQSFSLGDGSGSGIHGQILDSQGGHIINEFLVNSTTFLNQRDARVTALPNGNFVVTWTGEHLQGFGDNSDVYAQMFTNGGSPIGSEFHVNSPAADAQEHPAITTLTNGKFVIAWTDHTGGENNIRAQVFNANGTKDGTAFDVNYNKADSQDFPSITPLSYGRYIVSWETDAGANDTLTGRVFSSEGIAAGPEFTISGPGNGPRTDSTITELSDGRFVAAWTEGADTFNIHAQIFDGNGQKVGGQFLITTTNYAYGSSIAADSDGGFVIFWHQQDGVGTDYDLFGQKYLGNGTKSGSQFQVNTITAEDQGLNTAVTTLKDGRVLVTYTDDSHAKGDNSGDAIHAQIIDPREHGINLAGSDQNDDFVGTGFDDTIKGGGGYDYLRGADGNDILDGGASDDTLSGGPGFDTASYVNSGSAVQINLITNVNTGGEAFGDILYSIEKVIGSKFNDTLVGNGVDNAFEGGLGNDTIDGSFGDDTAIYNYSLSQYTVTDYGSKIVISGPEGKDTLTGIEHLKFADGTLDTADDGSPLFDTLYYLNNNPDVFHAGVNALAHFNASGWHEGRNPNAFFDTAGYLAANKDVAASGQNPLEHYHQTGWHEGRDPGASFDTTLYLIHNPDVAASGMDPLQHFLQFGRGEGRVAYQAIGSNIVNGFDAEYYLFHNPDVAAAGIDPLQHFNTFGWHEGRNPNGWFDTAGYLSHYSDIAAAGVNPLQHYEQFGWHEGRDPSAQFDTLKYLAANQDVAAAGVNPLDHFLNNGIYEGRTAMGDGLWH